MEDFINKVFLSDEMKTHYTQLITHKFDTLFPKFKNEMNWDRKILKKTVLIKDKRFLSKHIL